MADPYALIEEAQALLSEAYRAVDDALADAEPDCDRAHCDDYSCECAEPENSDIEEICTDYLQKLRMGYTLDVTLQDVLEEMERTIRA